MNLVTFFFFKETAAKFLKIEFKSNSAFLQVATDLGLEG